MSHRAIEGMALEAPEAASTDVSRHNTAVIATRSTESMRLLAPRLAAFGNLEIVGVLPEDPSSLRAAMEMRAAILFVEQRPDMTPWMRALEALPMQRRPILACLDAPPSTAFDERGGAGSSPEPSPQGAPANRLRDMLVLSEAHRFLVLRHHEIDWARAEGRWTTVYCIDRTHTVHRSLAAFERLLDPTQFVRIHRSMIVRLDRVREMFPGFNGDYDVILHNGTRLQLTRTYVRQFLARTATAEGAIGK